jgi:hypothetical protein
LSPSPRSVTPPCAFSLEPGEVGVEDEVDDAGDGVRTIGRRSAAGGVSTELSIASGNRLMSTPPKALVEGMRRPLSSVRCG